MCTSPRSAAALPAQSEGQTKRSDLALGVWVGEKVVRWSGWGSTYVVVGQGSLSGRGVAGPSGTQASSLGRPLRARQAGGSVRLAWEEGLGLL